MSIHTNLLEAYLGTYPDESLADWLAAKPGYVTIGPDAAQAKWAEARITSDTPHERLRVYLEWNGIFGYTGSIFSIATGEYQS